MYRPITFLAALGLTLIATASTASTRRPLRADDIYATRAVNSATVSPDGRWVAYLVTLNDRSSDERRSELRMVDASGHETVTLAAASASLRAPRFSPDGRYISYIATPAGEHHSQLVLLDRRGGEARVLTHLSGDIGDYDWSPDGGQIVAAIEAADPDVDDGHPHPKPWVMDGWHFKQDIQGYLASGHDRHLALVRVADGSTTPLTDDPHFQEDHPVWSPDGRWIAYTRTADKGGDRDGANDLTLLAPKGGTPRVLARPFVPNIQGLAFTPDSARLTYRVGGEPRYYAYQQDQLHVVSLTDGTHRSVTDGLDRAVMSASILPDGQTAVVAVEDDGSIYPATVGLLDGRTERRWAGQGAYLEVAQGGGLVVVVGGDDRTPNEVYALEGTQLRRLTHESDAFMDAIELGRVDDLTFRSHDGTEIHGLVTLPPGYTAGQRYPTALWIHGGPNGEDEHTQDYQAYQFRRQFLAAQGYVVVGINYRGSSGRGSAFARAIYADWGHKEVEDLLAGVDAVIARGYADPNRLVIGGWSYGGILTDYTIASDTRFKAAASGAGSANQFLMYGVDQYVLQYERELGLPWRNTAQWLKVSYPFFHADRIHTPTLFMGGDRDFNVPIAGGEQMYQALQALGIPTELVVYPDQFHDITRPSFIKDRLERVEAWFARFLKAP
jgi:dipeptidyl aminopeptidase/acylaminoacyl peptidase